MADGSKGEAVFVSNEKKLAMIRELYQMYYNTDQPVEVFAAEFYWSVGELLNDCPPSLRIEKRFLEHHLLQRFAEADRDYSPH